MTRILVTGDFLRPHDVDPSRSESVRRIRWFEDLLVPPLSMVTDLPVQRLACEGPWTMRRLYADCGLEPSLDAWARLYAGELGTPLRERIVEACQDAVVVSIELPPSVGGVLRDAGIPFIDATVDPHRFLTDIPLAWRSSLAHVRRALEPFRLSPFDIRRRAAQVKAKCRWVYEIEVPEGATLVLDQVPTDSAMIDPMRHRRVSWAQYLDNLAALRAAGPVLWRPHPYNADVAVVSDLLGAESQTAANIYHLFSHDNLVRVAAISSGGVVEARAFGKDGVHFLDRHAGIDIDGWATPTPVVGHWLSPHFWRAVLAPLVPVDADVPVLPVEKDFLRRSINCDWGFGWIDQVVAV